MMHALLPYAAQLMQAAGWGLLHSLWQGALIFIILSAIFRALPDMSARLKHGCALMGLLLLSLWTVNTAVGHWQQLNATPVRIIPAGTEADIGYVTELQPSAHGWSMPLLQSAMPWLMFCYCLGLIIMLTRLGSALRRLFLLRHRGTSAPDGTLMQTFLSLQLSLGIAQTVLLRLSTRVAVPVVIGALRPMILLPATMVEQLRPQELEAILLHELAHISRADFLINMFQSCVETLLFFNPFVWRISAIIRREREHCCDDLVIACTDQPLTYAQALTAIARQQASAPAIALAASGHQPLLLNRIKRIIEMKHHPLRYGHVIAACSLAAIIIAVSIVCFTPSLAQQRKKAPQSEDSRSSASRPYTRSRIIVIDSNGARHEYSTADELPPREKRRLEESMKQADAGLKMAGDALRQAGRTAPAPPPPPPGPATDAPEPPEAPEAPESAGPGEPPAAPFPPAIAWMDISRQVDSAMAQIDWKAIDRDINKSIVITQRTIADPELKARIRRSVAAAKRQMAASMEDREHLLADSRREVATARREMDRARREMDRARREMEQAKAALEREKEALQRRRDHR